MNPTNQSKQDMELRKRILYLVLKYGNDFAERRRSEDADEEATTDAIMQLTQSHDEAIRIDELRDLQEFYVADWVDTSAGKHIDEWIEKRIAELTTHPNEHGEE